MAWVVELLDDRVREELDVLPADMKARFRRIVELMQDYGFDQVREPHVRHRRCCPGVRQEDPEDAKAGN